MLTILLRRYSARANARTCANSSFLFPLVSPSREIPRTSGADAARSAERRVWALVSAAVRAGWPAG